MSELIQLESRYYLEPTTKFRRLISPTDLNIDTLGQVKELSEKINFHHTKIESVENSYGFHGQSPLNDEPAPPSLTTLALHDQLSSQKYQLELEQFFAVITPNLEAQAPETYQSIATDKMYKISKWLSNHPPEEVRQDLGDAHYVNWLANTTTAIELLGYDHPKSIDMINIISQHLDVTEEFAKLEPLRIKIKEILNTQEVSKWVYQQANTMATVAASPDR